MKPKTPELILADTFSGILDYDQVKDQPWKKPAEDNYDEASSYYPPTLGDIRDIVTWAAGQGLSFHIDTDPETARVVVETMASLVTLSTFDPLPYEDTKMIYVHKEADSLTYKLTCTEHIHRELSESPYIINPAYNFTKLAMWYSNREHTYVTSTPDITADTLDLAIKIIHLAIDERQPFIIPIEHHTSHILQRSIIGYGVQWQDAAIGICEELVTGYLVVSSGIFGMHYRAKYVGHRSLESTDCRDVFNGQLLTYKMIKEKYEDQA